MEFSSMPINILIVHSGIADVKKLKKVFSNTGIQLKELSHEATLAEALNFLKRHTTDIIFLELALTDSYGIATFKTIQSQSPQVPVVILTSTDDTKLALEAINNGAQDFLITNDVDEKILSKTVLYSIERKRLSESLLLSNERYKLVSKATKDMVWDWDLQKNKVYRNKTAWDRLFGDENDDSRQPDSWWERVHPADRKRTNGIIDNVLNNKGLENFEIECRVIKNDGTFAHVIDRGYAIRNDDGEAVRLIGVTQNVTKQKEAEEKLRASEQRFRSIIEKSNEGLALVSDKGELMDMSASGKNILGLTGDVTMEVIRSMLSMPTNIHPVESAYEYVMKKYGRVKVREYQFKKADGDTLWLEATFHNLLNVPAIQAVVIHFRDISARKVFEEGLKVSEEKYRNLFNANPSSIIICNPYTYSIIEVNEAAIKEFGYSKKEFLKMSTTDLVLPKEVAKLKRLYKKMQASADLKSQNIWEVITSKGEIKQMDATARAINYYGQQAMLTIANNISEKVNLEKKLEEERLKKQHEITTAVITAQEQERELLGKELHDNINQILATTKLYIEYALANDEMRESLLTSSKGFITSAVAELRNLSKTLLPPSLGEVGLIMALDELTESIVPVNKFKMHNDWQDLDETCLTEKLKLTIFRIIQEQLSNILKHSYAKNVWIKIKNKKKRLHITVKDDGVGFNVNEKSKGVGLKNITSRAALHNGIMKLTSEKGNGCTLSLKFNL